VNATLRAACIAVAEAVVDETARGSFPIDLDIEMLVFASGRERTESQWRSLLEGAGFKLVQARPLPGITGLVEAVVA